MMSPNTRKLYRCAGESCPGLPYKASDRPHPPSCAKTKRAAPGKGKRNRLTDLKCGWKHATEEERTAFLEEIGAHTR